MWLQKRVDYLRHNGIKGAKSHMAPLILLQHTASDFDSTLQDEVLQLNNSRFFFFWLYALRRIVS